MREVDVLADRQALGILIRENRCASRLGFAHYVDGAHIIQEAVVNAARVPCVDAHGPTERCIADQRVTTAVIVARVVVGAIVVLLSSQYYC